MRTFLDEARALKVNLSGGERAGRLAFAAGEQRLIPRDQLLRFGVDYGKAWYRGWDAANLAAPIEGEA